MSEAILTEFSKVAGPDPKGEGPSASRSAGRWPHFSGGREGHLLIEPIEQVTERRTRLTIRFSGETG